MKIKERFEVLKLHIAIIVCILATCFSASAQPKPTLKDLFKEDFLIGVALNRDQIMGKEPKAIALVEKHFNSITPENDLKWEKVHPEPDVYNFEPVDRMIEFAEKNKILVVGHTLLWHNQTPNWVFEDNAGNPVDRETLLQRLRNHIFTVAGRYKGRIHGWDVANEAVEDDGKMRQSKWLKIIGEDYIQKIFKWTAEADPNAELYYNDYNMWHAGKRQRVIQLVRDLQAKGVRIDGIGMQGHWGLDYPPLDELEFSLQAYAELGVKIMITELDVNVLPMPGNYTGAEITRNIALQKQLNPYVDGLPDTMQANLADRYAAFFKIFRKFSDKITRVTFWGVHDGQSWHNYWPVPGRTAHSLLFDRSYRPKSAFYAVIKTATN